MVETRQSSSVEQSCVVSRWRGKGAKLEAARRRRSAVEQSPVVNRLVGSRQRSWVGRSSLVSRRSAVVGGESVVGRAVVAGQSAVSSQSVDIRRSFVDGSEPRTRAVFGS
jgi:hypothetical protein